MCDELNSRYCCLCNSAGLLVKNGCAADEGRELVPKRPVHVLGEDVSKLLRACRVTTRDVHDRNHLVDDCFADLGVFDPTIKVWPSSQYILATALCRLLAHIMKKHRQENKNNVKKCSDPTRM